MTACANNNEGKVSGKKAVSATLAGVLAVGMVPAAALATEAPADGAADAGIDLLATDHASAIKDGKITAFEDGMQTGHSFTVKNEGQGLLPTKVKPWNEAEEVDVKGYYIFKLTTYDSSNKASSESIAAPNLQGLTVNGKAFYWDTTFSYPNGYMTDEYDAIGNYQLPTEVGNYAVFAVVDADDTAGTEDVVVTEAATFSIVTADIAGAELYEIDASDSADLSDTEFVFDGANWCSNKLGVKIGEKKLTEATDYKIAYYQNGVAVTTIKKAGTYTAVITGEGDYKNMTKRIDFEVKALDLSAAGVAVKDQEGKNPSPADITINNVILDGSAIESYVNVSYGDVEAKAGKASVTLSPNASELAKDGLDGSIIGTKTAEFAIAKDKVTVNATYDTTSFSTYSDANPLEIDLSASANNAFDATKIAATYTDPASGETVKAPYALRVTDTESGAVGDAEMLKSAGSYKIEVVFNASATNYAYMADPVTMYAKIINGTVVANADVSFTYKGDTITGKSLNYTPGYNVMDDIAVAVKTSNGELEADDYTVTVTKDVDGKKVETETITDAGEYTVTVKAPGYVDENKEPLEDSIKIEIKKRDLGEVTNDANAANVVFIRAKGTFNYTETENGISVEHRVLPYTGEEITPTYEWSCDATSVNDDDATWYDLPADDFVASYVNGKSKEADLIEVDEYVATIKAAKDSENYTGIRNAAVEVSDIKVFADVPTTHWGADYIYTAAVNKFMKGYNGSSIFGPDKAITRADAVIVLYNMAGGDVYETGKENTVNDFEGFMSDFTDVDKNAYYMAAVSWAQKVGITTGYTDGSGKFGPSDQITREQFATMLARYAALTGSDTSVDDVDAELAQYPDNGQIADWAKGAVAWLSEQEIMTGDKGAMAGYMLPGNDVTRAEVAKMAVSLQPEPAKDGIVIK